MRRTLLLLAAYLTLLLWLPLLSFALAAIIAVPAGCTLHEGFANPCVIAGVDWGEMLYNLAGMGMWMTLFMMPFMMLSLAGWVVYVMIIIIRRWRAWARRWRPDRR